MIGIYQIKNLINNKVYIGQSINVEERIKQHFRNAYNKKTHTYNYPLSRAIRKYGDKNFSYQILEKCSIDDLTEKEQYWIQNKKSISNGYNQEFAVEPKRGSKCNFAKLNEKQVEEIKELLKNSRILMSEIAEMYNVTGSAIEDINKGRRWATKESYPIRKNAGSISHQGERQNGSALSKKDVIRIRERFINEEINEIFKDYKSKIGFAGFKKVVYGVTWKHLPCYKKREKVWILPT